MTSIKEILGGFAMYDEKKMKDFRSVVMFVNMLLMGVTIILQIVAYDSTRHSIMCSCILLLVTAIMIFDGILKSGKDMIMHGAWYALIFGSLIISFFK